MWGIKSLTNKENYNVKVLFCRIPYTKEFCKYLRSSGPSKNKSSSLSRNKTKLYGMEFEFSQHFLQEYLNKGVKSKMETVGKKNI